MRPRSRTTSRLEMARLQPQISLDAPWLANLEWQQEICDQISSFGREKYVQFMALASRVQSVRARTVGFAKRRNVQGALGVVSAVGRAHAPPRRVPSR